MLLVLILRFPLTADNALLGPRHHVRLLFELLLDEFIVLL